MTGAPGPAKGERHILQRGSLGMRRKNERPRRQLELVPSIMSRQKSEVSSGPIAGTMLRPPRSGRPSSAAGIGRPSASVSSAHPRRGIHDRIERRSRAADAAVGPAPDRAHPAAPGSQLPRDADLPHRRGRLARLLQRAGRAPARQPVRRDRRDVDGRLACGLPADGPPRQPERSRQRPARRCAPARAADPRDARDHRPRWCPTADRGDGVPAPRPRRKLLGAITIFWAAYERPTRER